MARPRVLLVEDDLDVRDTLQDLLESEGLDVIPAANGKDMFKRKYWNTFSW